MSNSDFSFRARRTTDQAPTRLESYAEANIMSLLRYHMPMRDQKTPSTILSNYNFSPLVESAARICEIIDLFDENEGLLDQVIFGLVHPELCDPGVKNITQDRNLVTVLLVRHFKKFGGLVLPPLPAARDAQEAYVQTTRADLAAGRQPGAMHYPNWTQTQNTTPASGLSGGASRGGSSSRGRRGSNMGRGGSGGRGGRGGGY